MTLRRVRVGSIALAASVALAVVLATCTQEPAGPTRRTALSVVPVLPAGANVAAFNLTLDNVRLIVVRAPADTVFDRTSAFPANQSSLALSADVPLEQSTETFQVTIQLLSGTTLLFTGTQTVAVTAGQSTPPAQIPVTYAGPGQNIATLALAPADSVLSFGGTLTFRPTAQDAQGNPVTSFYVSWTTSDTVAAPIDATGTLAAPALRRTVTVTARTPTGITASTPITFAPLATALAVVSGCGQVGPLGTQLPQPVVAKVTASDGLGVPGVVVTFTPPAGASVAASQVVTDSTGLAQTLMTLGSTSGSAVFQVSAPGLTTVACGQTGFGAAAQLAFIAQPTTAAAGAAIAPAVVVAAEDAQGTLVPTFTGNVTITLGTNPSNGILSGTTTVAAVGGLASFATLSVDKAGVGYTLQAAAAALAGATSAAFNVAAGSASRLLFTVQPVTTPSGTVMPAVVVTALDSLGNTVTTFAGTVTVSIDSGPAGAILSGTLGVSAVAGVATFADLKLDKAGSYHLRAHATGLTDAISALFDVTVGLTRQVVFTAQPSNVTAGGVITPAVQVEVQDLQGNLDPTYTGGVTMSIGTNPGGGTLLGTDSVNAIAGVATFTNLIIDKSGAGYTLQAAATGIAAGASNSFTVTAGAAARLAFVVPPSPVGVSAVITPAVVVGIEDTLGNLVTTATNQVDMRIGVNPSNGILGGTTTLNAVNGLATFSDLTINQPGTGYTLVAGSGSLAPATSPAFDVSAGAITFHVQVLPDTFVAGSVADVQVTALDGNGNVVPSYTGTITFSSSDPLATLPADYTFTPTDAGTRLFAGGATLRTAPSVTVTVFDTKNSGLFGFTTVTVNPDVATKLAFTLEPVDVVQNATMATVRVGIEDQFGNLVTTATNQVGVAIGTNPGGGTLTGGAPLSPVSGEASFNALSISQAGNGYTLVATSGSLTSATSSAFNVLPASVKQWTGAVSADWSSAGNWTPTGAPTASDDVLIPLGLATYPTLSASSAVRNLTMQSGASIATAGFPLDVFGNLDAPSGQITGTGTVLLDGTGVTLQGSFPNVQAGGTVRVIGTVIVSGDLDITGTGVVDLGTAQTVFVTGAITTGSSAVLVDTGGSVITVNGDAIFGGGSEAGKLTSGTLQLVGNFTQNGDVESYATDSAFFTVLLGTATQQLVTFANPGAGAGSSHFAGLEVFDTAGVSLASPVFVNGSLFAAPTSTVPPIILGNGNTMTVQGFTLDSLIIDNMPLVVTNSPQGLFGQDVTFQNFSPAAIQLDITRNTGPGVTFTNFKFLGTPPTTGWQLFAHDPVIGNGAFSVTMVTPSPTQAQGARFTADGEATVIWP